eukprot:5308637-Ditylum_brightwellii.AAC.1
MHLESMQPSWKKAIQTLKPANFKGGLSTLFQGVQIKTISGPRCNAKNDDAATMTNNVFLETEEDSSTVVSDDYCS